MTLVQVVYSKGNDNWSSRSYTYEDPTGDLEVGDWVEVPVKDFGGFEYHELAKVVELGSDYTGPCKQVSGRVERDG